MLSARLAGCQTDGGGQARKSGQSGAAIDVVLIPGLVHDMARSESTTSMHQVPGRGTTAHAKRLHKTFIAE